MTTLKERDQQASIARLREILTPGDTVYTVMTHVSRSGMLRHIKPLAHYKGEVVNISWDVARALDWQMNKDRDAVKVDGCGMDMGFHLVYCLSYELYQEMAKNPPEILKARANITNQSAGYWLTQRWL